MKLFNVLPIQSIEVGPGLQVYAATFAPSAPNGKKLCACDGSDIHPIVFNVPLDGSVMSPDVWITRDNIAVPFCGVDRSLDPPHLSGFVGAFPDNVLPSIDGFSLLVQQAGAAPDVIYYDTGTWFLIQSNTWTWITVNQVRVALVCTNPGLNGKMVTQVKGQVSIDV